MIIFDTNILTWSYETNAPTARDLYTATLLLNGVIVYVGGRIYVPQNVDEINLYDTKSDSWYIIKYFFLFKYIKL